MSKFYIPANSPDDWKVFLADPEKHWRTGFSAKSLAYSWENSGGDFPPEIKTCLDRHDGFRGARILFGFPEHKVPLPGGATQSQNDIFIVARTDSDLLSITVEGKVSESFGPTLEKWLETPSDGKRKRLNYLKDNLGLQNDPPPGIRYQLLHRTASAVIEAKRLHAKKALMIVHSFSPIEEWFEDFDAFVSLFRKESKKKEVIFLERIDNVDLFVSWVSEKFA